MRARGHLLAKVKGLRAVPLITLTPAQAYIAIRIILKQDYIIY